MAIERTLSIIKPDATAAPGATGEILRRFEEAGLAIVALKKIRLTETLARGFYAVHKERPFYGDLVKYMSSGPIVAMILEKDNAVEDFRKLIGATNPAQAEEGTIRRKYAKSIEANAVHGSDAAETAAQEIAFFFPCLNVYSR